MIKKDKKGKKVSKMSVEVAKVTSIYAEISEFIRFLEDIGEVNDYSLDQDIDKLYKLAEETLSYLYGWLYDNEPYEILE